MSHSKKLSLKQMIHSVLSAFIGIQKKDNATEDFKHGSLITYAFIGIIAVIIFIMVIVGIVKWVLAV